MDKEITTSIPSPRVSVHHPKLAMVSMMLGAFVGMFSETSLNIALPQLMVQLHVNQSTIQWLVTGYMLIIGIIISMRVSDVKNNQQ